MATRCSNACIVLLIIRVCVYLRTRAPTRPRFKFRTRRLRYVVLGEKPTTHRLKAGLWDSVCHKHPGKAHT